MTQGSEIVSQAPVEILSGVGCPVILLCEHASLELPDPWIWPKEDQWLVGTHWSWDIGVDEFCRLLANTTGCSAILARFSRLLIDVNRDLGAPTLIRKQADGRIIKLNHEVSEDEMRSRIENYWLKYHDAAHQLVHSVTKGFVLGLHSFTDNYEGSKRTMEVGVLFDQDEDVGVWSADWLRERGLNVVVNEPYSGKNGLMYSPQRHATANHRKTIELEIRQDLLGDNDWRMKWAPVFGEFIRALSLNWTNS